MAKRKPKGLPAAKKQRSRLVVETDEQIVDEIIEEFIEEEATNASVGEDSNRGSGGEANLFEESGYAPGFAAAAGYLAVGQSLVTAATDASLLQQESSDILHVATVDAVQRILFSAGRRQDRD